MGYLGLFIHSGFGDQSGSAMEVTPTTIQIHLAQLYSFSRHNAYTIRSHIQHL